MTEQKSALKQTFSHPVVGRSVWVAIIVGTVLNAINQGPEIWHGDIVHIWKLVLTYCVPFLVASYGSWSALRIRH